MQTIDLRGKIGKFPLGDLGVQRPYFDSSSLQGTVEKVLQEVKEKGDEAVRRFTLQFDKADIQQLRVSDKEMDEAEKFLTDELKQSIVIAKNNIEKFHKAQLKNTEFVETMPGVECWRKSTAIEKVGLYIPGGTAPLFSTILMLGIPAKLVGCRQIILCSPPDTGGKLNNAILFTAKLVGITKIFRVGGVQAIAAMAYGTESIPKVYKIFGPGNQYVTCAKQLLQNQGMAIDLPAGPSEVAVYADETAHPAFVAADLLSQAEHGIDSQVLLITYHQLLINEMMKELDKQIVQLPRKEVAAKALENSKIILVKNETEGIALINEYAPEHLILACANADDIAEKIINAGSVFLGHYSPESVGDYASGTNHVLPTNGYAKAYSGVSVDSFVKKITFQKLSEEGLKNIGRAVELMAEAEGLHAHANAVKMRKPQTPKGA
ncbi:MAG TPA: histidinol dehydrogenase [Chitinophagaceae bacterium]|jgi:histidinol dehydrogenase|nr:histidinol dehydrogenase [Chitinophagaceae bacterium]